METALTPLEFARRARSLYGDREAVIDGEKIQKYVLRGGKAAITRQ
jgi:hypothetical protein